MQTRLKIALGAVGFALAAIPAFAVEMPTEGSKNFSPPTDAPSYFANETVPESARSTARHPLTTKRLESVPQHRTSSRMTGAPRPIGRPDTSPKATALRRITPNEQCGKCHRGTGGGQLPLRIGRVIAGAPEWVGSLRS